MTNHDVTSGLAETNAQGAGGEPVASMAQPDVTLGLVETKLRRRGVGMVVPRLRTLLLAVLALCQLATSGPASAHSAAASPQSAPASPQTAPRPALDPSDPARWQVPPAELQALRFRELGPFRGGRVTTVAGVRSIPHTF